IPCPHANCSQLFKTAVGLKHHQSLLHNFSFTLSSATSGSSGQLTLAKPAPGIICDYHDKLTGCICDANSRPIGPNTPPPPISEKRSDDWGPYDNQLQFETAKFIFKDGEMSAGNINKLCDLWGRSLSTTGTQPPFSDHKELFATIDATPLGDITWDSFKLKYNGEHPTEDVPPWMDEMYEFWFHNAHALVESILLNTEFDGKIDYVPY
ncbi:hypothetical protein SCLCIDRAFT_1167826, partial [Scleroderma citrinum Foug A]